MGLYFCTEEKKMEVEKEENIYLWRRTKTKTEKRKIFIEETYFYAEAKQRRRKIFCEEKYSMWRRRKTEKDKKENTWRGKIFICGGERYVCYYFWEHVHFGEY